MSVVKSCTVCGESLNSMRKYSSSRSLILKNVLAAARAGLSLFSILPLMSKTMPTLTGTFSAEKYSIGCSILSSHT